MVVVDTSVVLKWFDEKESSYARAIQILENHLYNREKIIVPDLILYEISNAWATKSRLTNAQCQRRLNTFFSYTIEIVIPDHVMFGKALRLAKENSVTVYDALYAVVAKERHCRLITADTKFVQAMHNASLIPLDA